jgi:hypothetical protein
MLFTSHHVRLNQAHYAHCLKTELAIELPCSRMEGLMFSNLSHVVSRFFNLRKKSDEFMRSLEEIELILSEFPFELPQEVYDFYFLINGLNLAKEPFLDDSTLLDVEIAVKQYKELSTEKYYKSNWFPLFYVEDSLFVVVGQEERQKTSPVYSIYLDNLSTVEVNLSSTNMFFSSIATMLALIEQERRI